MEFNSQICTSREQSERLLALGLKKETADMCWTLADSDREGNQYSVEYMSIGQGKYQLIHPDWYIPAWSLDRLIEILNVCRLDFNFNEFANAYEYVISYFEVQVKDGYINKKYLEE